MAGTFYKQFIRANYIFGIALMIVFVPHSKILLSIAQFWLTGTFAIDRFNNRSWLEFFRKSPLWKSFIGAVPLTIYLFFSSILKGLRAFFNNKAAIIFSSIMLMHFIGLIYTTDFEYAFKDIRTKAPLFLLPLFISTSPAFNKRYFYGFMLLFTASVIVRTLMNSWNLFQGHFVDIRDISKSISHVVLALEISFALFVLGYFIAKRRIFRLGWKLLFCLTAFWFLAYLVISHSATGIIITSITLIIYIIIFTLRSEKLWLKLGLLSFLFVSITTSVVYISRVVNDYYKVNPVNFSKLDKLTSRGNPYFNDTLSKQTENGNYQYIYIQPIELMDAWAKRSPISFLGHDKKHQLISNTLVRYLASKGLRKDADGVAQLTTQDVKAIENGVANVVFTRKFSIRGEVYEFLWGYDEYRNSGDPTGSSFMQRLEFWKASLGIIKEKPLTGVGTGDMNEAFQQEYVKMNSKLAPDQRWRSHNQFLSIFVGFGIFGLLWFLFAILYPPLMQGKYKDFFFLLFFIIVLLSMTTEDTLESQMGVTFFAFFYSFLLWGKKEEDRFI
jgi:hypothetical protein